MLNHVNVVSQSRDEERDGPIWKIALLGLFGAGAILLATASLVSYLSTATSELFFVIAGAGLIAVVVFVLQAFFIKSTLLLRTLVLIETALPLVLFADRLLPVPSPVLLGAVGFFFLFTNSGSLRGARQAAASTAVRFFDIARTVISKALTGALLFTVALIYLTYFSWGTLHEAVGRRFVNQVLTSAEPALKLYFARASVDQTVGEFLTEVVRAKLEGGRDDLLDQLAPSGGNGEVLEMFRNLPPPQRDAVVAQTTERFRVSLEPFLGTLNPSEPVRDAIYRVLRERLSGLSPSQYATFTVGGLALVFFTLKGFLSLFHWFIALVAYLVFKLLVALGFARVGVATQTREFVILS